MIIACETRSQLQLIATMYVKSLKFYQHFILVAGKRFCQILYAANYCIMNFFPTYKA